MSRCTSAVFLATYLTFLAFSSPAQAQQYWDGNTTSPTGTITGGSGTWDVVGGGVTNWTNASGTANSVWGDGLGTGTDTAVFTVASNISGTYLVSISTPYFNLMVPGMTFNVGGYTITDSAFNGISLTGTNAFINTVEGATNLNVSIAGPANVIKTGNGQLILSGNNAVGIGSNDPSPDFLTSLTLNAGSLVGTASAGTLGGTATLLTLNGGVGFQNYLQLSSSSGQAYGNNVILNGSVLVINDDTVSVTGTNVNNSFGTLALNGTLFSTNNALNGTGSSSNLIFGATTLSGTSDAIISFTYGGTNQVVLASVDGSASNTNLVVGGNSATTISGTTNLGSGNLIKNNSGTLLFNGVVSTTGSIIINQENSGNVTLGGTGASSATFAGAQNILVNGGTLQLGSAITVSGTVDRISNTGTLTLAGAQLLSLGVSGGGSETIGTLMLGDGFSRFNGQNVSGGTGNTITFTNFGGRTTGATVDFLATGTGIGAVTFTNAPTLTGSIIGGWATAGDEFAGITSTGNVQALGSATTGTYTFFSGTDFSGSSATTNVKETMTSGTGVFLQGATTVNSLNMVLTVLAGGVATVDLNGFSLDLVSGGVIAKGTNATPTPVYNILDGTLTAGTGSSPAEVIINANTNVKYNLGVTIADNTSNGPVSLVLTGLSVAPVTNFFLSGANTYSGGTYLEDGVTTILTDHQLGASSGAITLSNGASLRFVDYAVPMAISSSRNIILSGGGGTIIANVEGGVDNLSNVISGNGSITYNTSTSNGAKVVISGANTYDGLTILGVGANTGWYFTSVGNIGGGASALGAPTTAANGIIVLGGASPTWGYVGVGAATTDRQFEWNTNGGGTLQADGSGIFTINGNITAVTNNGSSIYGLGGYGVGVINGDILQTLSTPLALKLNTSSTNNGVWQLNGENTFTGAITITSGILEFNTVGNIGSGPSALGSATAATGTIALSGGMLRFVGNSAQSTDRLLNVTAASGLQSNGSNGATVTYIGGATLGGNTLTLGGTGGGFFSGGGIISGTGGSLTMQGLAGLGTWILNQSTQNTYTGATSVNAGTLVLDFSNLATPTNLVVSTSALTLGGGTLRILGKNGANTLQTFGAVTLTADTGSALNLVASGTNTTTLATGTWTNKGAATLDIRTSGTVVLTASTAPTAPNGILDYVTYNGINFATVSGTTIIASDSSTYNMLPTSGTGSNTGTFQLTSSATMTSAVKAYGLVITPGGSGQSLSLGTFGLGVSNGADLSIIFNGTSNAYSINGTGAIGDGNNNTLYISTAGTNALTISAPLLSSPAVTNGKFIKTGTGTLILSGTNVYADQTDLQLGTLQAGSNTGFSNSSNFNVGPSGILATGGFNVGVLFLSGSGIVDNGSSTDSVLTIGAKNTNSGVGANGPSASFTGIIQDGGTGKLSLVKAGYGQQNLSNAYNSMSTYSGSTSILSGVLNVSMLADSTVASSIGTGSQINLGSVGQLATLQISDSLTANNETNRSITIAAGSTGGIDVVGAGGVGGSSTYTLTNGTLDGALLTASGNISGGGTLLKLGTGDLDLTGSNSYTGGTVVDQGILRFSTTASISPTGSITVNYGGTVGTGAGVSLAGLMQKITTNSGGVIALGADNSENLDFSNLPNAALGALGHNIFSGTITPNSISGYQLGGGGWNGIYGAPASGPNSVLFIANANTLTGTSSVTISPHGTAGASVVFDDTQNFSGALTVIGGINAAYLSASSFPNNGNGFGSTQASWLAVADLTLAGGSSGSLTGVSAINLGPLGDLKLLATAQNVNRLPDATPINFTGGSLAFMNDSTAGSTGSYAETTGTVNLISGSSEIYTGAAVGGQTSTLTISKLNRSAGATVLFAGPGLGVSGTNTIVVNGAVSTGKATPWAFYGGGAGLYQGDNAIDFAFINSSSGTIGSVTAVSGTPITAPGSLLGGDYTLAGTGLAITGTLTANTLRMTTGASTLTFDAGSTLQVNGILAADVSSGTAHAFTFGAAAGDNSFLTAMAGTQEIVMNSSGGNQFGQGISSIIVNNNIVNNGAAVSVVKTGVGDLTLSGTNNSFSGGLVIDGIGSVIISNATAQGTGTITLNSGAIRFASTLAGTSNISNDFVVNNDAVILDSATAAGIQYSGRLAVNAGTLYWINNTNVSKSITGIISGTGTVAFQGGGTAPIILAGAASNTNTGLTTIEGREDGAAATVVSLEKTGTATAINGNILLGVSSVGSTNNPGETQAQEVLILNNSNVATGTYSTNQIADSSVITFQGGNGYDAGIFRLNNQSETIGGIQSSTTGDGLIQNNSSTLGASTLTLATAAGTNYTFSGLVQNRDNSNVSATFGTLAITKTGSGTQTFTNANTYTGGTQILGGSFYANNLAGSATGTGTLTVANGATLGGTGFINSLANTVNGRVNIGQATATDTNTNSILTMTATGTTTFSGANLVFNLSTTSTASTQLAAGNTHDMLFNGSNNTLTFNLQGSGVITGMQYTLITSTVGGSNLGTSIFGGDGLTIAGNTISGFNLTFVNGITSYNGTILLVQDGAGYDLDLLVGQAVPEPGTWMLMLGGLAILAVYQRSRRSKNV